VLPADFPKRSGSARNAYILAAIDDGRIVPAWRPLTVITSVHTATFYVLGDALKLGGTRLSTSAYNLQQIADKLRASLMTPRLIDWCFLKADIVIPPQTAIPDDSIAALEQESSKMTAAILAATGGIGNDQEGIVAPIGKNWCLSNVLLGAKPGHAALYGWACERGYVPPPGVVLRPGTLPGINNIQPLATPHDLNYTDYAMLTSLVRRDCVLDGKTVDVQAIMQSPDLAVCGLVSHEGPLRVLRQPGVPALPPITPPTTMVSGAEYSSAKGTPLPIGTQVQLKQHEEHLAKKKHNQQHHPVKSGFHTFFWQLVGIPLTTIVGITVGKVIEKRKAGQREEP
jgi:hypothetical protein